MKSTRVNLQLTGQDEVVKIETSSELSKVCLTTIFGTFDDSQKAEVHSGNRVTTTFEVNGNIAGGSHNVGYPNADIYADINHSMLSVEMRDALINADEGEQFQIVSSALKRLVILTDNNVASGNYVSLDNDNREFEAGYISGNYNSSIDTNDYLAKCKVIDSSISKIKEYADKDDVVWHAPFSVRDAVSEIVDSSLMPVLMGIKDNTVVDAIGKHIQSVSKDCVEKRIASKLPWE